MDQNGTLNQALKNKVAGIDSKQPLPGFMIEHKGDRSEYADVEIDLSQLDLENHMAEVKSIIGQPNARVMHFMQGSIDQCNLAIDLFLDGIIEDPNDNLVHVRFASSHIGLKVGRILLRLALRKYLRIDIENCTIDFEGAAITDIENIIIEEARKAGTLSSFKYVKGTLQYFPREMDIGNGLVAFHIDNCYANWLLLGVPDPDTFPFESVLNVWRQVDSLNRLCLHRFYISQKAAKMIRDAISAMDPTRKVSLRIDPWEDEAAFEMLHLIRSEPRLQKLELGRDDYPLGLDAVPAAFLAKALSFSIYLESVHIFLDLDDIKRVSAAIEYVENLISNIGYPNRLTTIGLGLSAGYVVPPMGFRDEATDKEIKILNEKNETLQQALSQMQTSRVRVLIMLIWATTAVENPRPSPLRLLPLEIIHLLAGYFE